MLFLIFASQRKFRSTRPMGVENQSTLDAARVAIVGAGGLGSPCALYLSAAGIGNITIIDDDVIELTNLHRQILYKESDVGLPKVAQAKEAMRNNCSSMTINAVEQKIDKNNVKDILHGHDVILDCSDNYQTRYLINRISRQLSIPLVTAAIYKQEGYVTTFNYLNGPCLECLFPSPPPAHLAENCSDVGVLGVDVGLAGLFQAKETISVLLKKPNLSGTLLSIKFESLTIKKRSITKISSCTKATCSQSISDEVFIEVPDISFAEYQALAQTRSTSLCLVDVRTPSEHLLNNIGGINIPLANFESTRITSYNNTVILYCKSGCRSKNAAKILLKKGFKNVFSLKGGLDGITTT